jgi:hypothetical protein
MSSKISNMISQKYPCNRAIIELSNGSLILQSELLAQPNMDWSEVELLIPQLKYAPCPFAHGHRIHCKLIGECFAKVLQLDNEDSVGICLGVDIPAADLDVMRKVLKGLLLECWTDERLISALLQIKNCIDEKGAEDKQCDRLMFIFAASTLPALFEENGTCIECLYSNATKSKK